MKIRFFYAEIFGASQASERAASELTVAMITPLAPKRTSKNSSFSFVMSIVALSYFKLFMYTIHV